ncbi:Phosphotransferase system, sorbose-specific IIC subunit [Moorella glycerini]|uniref:N-acetylgalactosamine permease IIC component 1 n=1 Tax=Neomoorella stamsii TaxID=1266720 RepID=A0A9X7J531_9FIRM|nr:MULTISPECIES: PTS sugar transporter subunit IIC [Moorella]PRR74376.1 N-acetylgalactosamine permease IIC component 1 [Moorella stamsii]CEP66783.1 Phosphotransferase system, sorbose-specific IIC subunit [Moorella glycerini]
MELWQAAAIAFVGYLGWIATPWLGGQPIGWYVFGRPLIAGTLVGLILGDLPTGMMIGATINALYIGAVTPGGAMAADLNFAGYVGTALAMLTKVSPEVAVTLAVPLGLVGTFTWQLFATVGVFFAHAADRYAEKANIPGLTFMLMGAPQILAFILRFVPAFLVIYFGAPIANNLVALIPAWLTKALTVIGGMLPALGMAVLLKMLNKDNRYIAFFLLGFLAVAALKLPILPVSVAGVALALINLIYTSETSQKEA